MSVSDPLIKDIKGCILAFLEEIKINHCINDSNSILLLFCQSLEKILNHGLVPVYSPFGFCKFIDPWVWLEKTTHDKNVELSYSYLHAVETVKLCRNVITNVGKLRLLIRLCLLHKCLHIPIEYLKNFRKLNVYKENSIIGDEILCEIFLSVLRQCSKINFKLNASNSSFLDLSWLIPELIKLEYVPCDTLGMTVSFAGEKAIIMSVQPNSVASENGRIEVGDVLDSLNGVQICSATKGRLRTIFKSCKGRPIVLTIIKAVYSDTKQIYFPIINLLRHVRVDPDILKSRVDLNDRKADECFSNKNNAIGTGLKVTYMGCVQVGHRGDVKQIDKAVSNFLAPAISLTCDEGVKYEKIKKIVSFELGELGVRCVDPINSEVVLKHSYMEISACGSVSSLPNYFAYIAGDEYCNLAKNFTCYIFFTKNSDAAYTILQSIGQGFHRTHFAV